jgi:uncharacterized membrane protein
MATSTSIARSESERAITTLAVCIAGGSVGIVLFALQASSFIDFFAVIGASLLTVGACLVSGGLLGFLFGIPKKLIEKYWLSVGR